MRFPLGFLVALRGLALREMAVLAILCWWSLSPSLLGPIGRICSDSCDFLSPGLFGRVGRVDEVGDGRAQGREVVVGEGLAGDAVHAEVGGAWG